MLGVAFGPIESLRCKLTPPAPVNIRVGRFAIAKLTITPSVAPRYREAVAACILQWCWPVADFNVIIGMVHEHPCANVTDFWDPCGLLELVQTLKVSEVSNRGLSVRAAPVAGVPPQPDLDAGADAAAAAGPLLPPWRTQTPPWKITDCCETERNARAIGSFASCL